MQLRQGPEVQAETHLEEREKMQEINTPRVIMLSLLMQSELRLLHKDSGVQCSKDSYDSSVVPMPAALTCRGGLFSS